MFFKKTPDIQSSKVVKKDKPSFSVCDSVGKTWFSAETVNVQKVGKVRYKTNYDIPFGNKQKFSNPRISYTANGKWVLTVGIECETKRLF